MTFGCKITARKAKARTTALDPNCYEGIFLGYRATTDTIRYWDVHNQCERQAKHVAKDETMYGKDPTQRSPAAKHLIEIFTQTPHAQRFTDKILDNQTTTTNNHHALQEVQQINTDQFQTELTTLPQQAAAAKAVAYKPLTMEELIQDIRNLNTTIELWEPHSSECIPTQGTHPTLGLRIEPHPDLARCIQFQGCIPGTTAHKHI